MSEDTTPTMGTATIPQNQEIENLEVHHHPDRHHKPKKWKEYLLEFLMIFIAVTLGFFAESFRESVVNHQKEEEYIKSMVEDLRADTVTIAATKGALNKINREIDIHRSACLPVGRLAFQP